MIFFLSVGGGNRNDIIKRTQTGSCLQRTKQYGLSLYAEEMLTLPWRLQILMNGALLTACF